MRSVEIEPTFEAWQAAARALLRDGIPPDEVEWREAPRREPGSGVTQIATPAVAPAPAPVTRVPRAFLDLARSVASHPDRARWRLLYRTLWRLVHEERALLEREPDPDVARLRRMDRECRSAAVAPRTPPVSAGVAALVAVPEVAGAAPFVPAGASLDDLREAGRHCQGCDLYRHATQMVFGRGPIGARVVLVGEQPGDQEDLRGAPFVGPAGEVLDRALAEVGLDRERLYVTNVVKHFKFVPRGKRRIHQTPGLSEILACRPWLDAELALIQPEALVCLGATAAQALLGPDFRVMREHGRFFATPWAARTTATIHPSAVLRGEDEAAKARLFRMLVDDLRLIVPAV